jgi:hypothetical protein
MKKTSRENISEIVLLLDCVFKIADIGITGITYHEEAKIIRIQTDNPAISSFLSMNVIDISRKDNWQILRDIFSIIETQIKCLRM